MSEQTQTHTAGHARFGPDGAITGPCVYCDTTTMYYCEHCNQRMCGQCVPGNDCPNCNPFAFEGNTMMSAVSSWDEEDEDWRVTRNSYNQEGHDEMSHDDYLTCECDECVLIREHEAIGGRGVPVRPELQPLRDHLLKTRAYRMLKPVLAGAAIIAACLLPSPASAHTGGTHDYPVIGTPAYDASCTIVREWEHGSAVATCGDGYHYVFDADGRFFYMHGIRFWISHENQWHNAPYTPDTLPYTTEGS